MADAKKLVSQMTLEEKASLCSGLDFWHLKGIQRLGLPSIMVTDGPHGLRKQANEADHLGINASVPATCFPTASATAASFDADLLREIGVAMGEACQAEDVAVILGPGCNIKRSPLCGRNFEYFSEDPLLSGFLAAALIEGVQSQGVGTSLKHFAANNQEKYRLIEDSVVDERALREIYLSAFEYAVKKARPWTVMCSYNRVDGIYASENKRLLTDILREQWGFGGLVMSDWGATNDRVMGVLAGMDLQMPGTGGVDDAEIVRAVREGRIEEAAVDTCALRVVELILRWQESRRKTATYSADEHHCIARFAAAESAVLLKNDNGLLPLENSAKIAVIGQFAKTPRYQGSGSSKINPHKVDSALENLDALGVPYSYADGYSLQDHSVQQDKIDEAVILAKGMDAVIVFAGLPDEFESEGFDRESLDLPESHNRLISALTEANPNTVVVLQGGAPMALPWRHKVSAILLMYLGGEAVNAAATDVLFGLHAPGGHLPETWPLSLEDVPCRLYFPGTARTVEYRESIFVGYRWYDTAQREVAYPFGHGLSYTSFQLENLHLSAGSVQGGEPFWAELTATNTGDRPGSCVVQLYVSRETDGSPVFRPEKELCGFAKVWLVPGEGAQLRFELNDRSLRYYNKAIDGWAVESGSYTFSAGLSSRDIRCTATAAVTGDGLEARLPDYRREAPVYYDLPKEGHFKIGKAAFTALYGKALPPSERQPGEPYSENTTLADIQHTRFGRMLKNLLYKNADSILGNGQSEDVQRMMEAMAMDTPLRTLSMMSSGKFTKAQMDGVVMLLNKKPVKGVYKIIRKK